MSILEVSLPELKKNPVNTSGYRTSLHYLSECAPLIIDQKWDLVLDRCHNFLIEFPLSFNYDNKHSEEYSHFRKVASVMLGNNHNYDSVVNLWDIGYGMTEFTKTYFHSIDKKGIALPQPEATKEEVIFIYSFCISFSNMILSFLDEDE